MVMMEIDDFDCYYLRAYIFLPAAVLVSLLVAYDVVTFLSFRKTPSRRGVYWLFRSKPLSFFDRLTEQNLKVSKERHMEQRCLWYHVHVACSDADSLPNVTISNKQNCWRRITSAIHSGNPQNPMLELHQLLWRIVKCCLIRLQETPRFLHEDYPQPRCVLQAFLLHSTPLLLQLDSESRIFLCERLLFLLLLIGVTQVHSSEYYSVRRLFREHHQSRETDSSVLSSWRFNFWTFLRRNYRHQIDPRLYPGLALHLVLRPSLSLQLLSENDVAASYIERSESLIEASRRFISDLSDALVVWDAREDALCCLHKFDKAFMDSVPRQTCDEIPTLCDDDTNIHSRKAAADGSIQLTADGNRQLFCNLDLIEAKAQIASTYLNFGAHAKGLQRLEAVCELLDENLSKALQDVSHSLRSLALVAWARSDGKKRVRKERHVFQKPDDMRMLGEQLFSLHLKLKVSPTKGTLVATSARLCRALSVWKREFSEYSIPPCWGKCRDEIVSLIHVSRIGVQALDSICAQFYDDAVNKQQRSDFAFIFSTLSQTSL